MYCNGDAQEGGEISMVEDTIQAIRKTEAEADAIVKEAEEKSQMILKEAREEAERICAEAEAAGKVSMQNAMEKARSAGEEFLQSAHTKTEREVQALKELAAQKETEAVSAVISQLV